MELANNESKKYKIYPFIDDLVNALYTDELNSIIESDNVQFDKRTFLMFIIMYFGTRLYATNENISKSDIKIFLTNMIRNPDKRIKCIELFMMFEKNLNEITEGSQDVNKNMDSPSVYQPGEKPAYCHKIEYNDNEKNEDIRE